MAEFYLEPIDMRGRRIRKGDLVRMVGVPDLATMPKHTRAESEPVFLHLRGTCKRTRQFNRYGLVELSFKIRAGPLAGWRGVAIEPNQLLRQDARHVA